MRKAVKAIRGYLIAVLMVVGLPALFMFGLLQIDTSEWGNLTMRVDAIGHVEQAHDPAGWADWQVVAGYSESRKAYVLVCSKKGRMPLSVGRTVKFLDANDPEWQVCSDEPWLNGSDVVWQAAGDDTQAYPHLAWDEGTLPAALRG
jgi:hypothetical protein